MTRRSDLEPRTILHVLGWGVPGGAAQTRLVASLARGLDPERYRVAAAFLWDDGPLLDELRADGAVVTRTPWYGGWHDVAGAVRFARAVRTNRPSIVHHHVGGLTLSYMVRVSARALVIAHVHGARAESGAEETAVKIVRGADAIVATSSAAIAGVRGSAQVIPPGVAVPAEPPPLPEAGGPYVIGTASRLAPIKGIVHLLRAMPAVLRSAGDVVLEILGEGPLEKELRGEAARLGIEDRVRFLGWHPDPGPVLERLDVYVQPSLYEGFGISTLEAMARARPVVATAVGGTLELIGPGTGVLVAPADDAALADAITGLLVDPGQRHALAEAAWKRAHDFSEARMVQATAALYDELLGAGVSRGSGGAKDVGRAS